jgi:hypothetical protein
MEQQKRPRSPWFYALLGCGGLAASICLGFTILFAVCAKKAQSISEGMSDPAAAKIQAVEMLGAIPDGYYAIGSMDMFFVKMAMLADEPPPLDKTQPFRPKRSFRFVRLMANDNNARVKAFFTEDGKDTTALENSGLNVRPEDIVKRGQLNLEGRKLRFVVARGTISNANFSMGDQRAARPPPVQGDDEAQSGLHASVLFDCPGDALNIGIWSMLEEDTSAADAGVSFKGTVADESAMAAFLKSMKPCEHQ